jgi:phosphoglycerol transferase
MRGTRGRRLLIAVSQPLVIGLAVWLMLGGTRWDVDEPLALGPDAAFTIVQANATLVNDWWWSNPALGALSHDDPLLRPEHAHVDQVLLRLVGLVLPDPVRAVTATWILMLLLAGATAKWCLERIGVSPLGACCAGILFALCPFALSRNTTAPGLTPYLVPFAATSALLLAGTAAALTRRHTWGTLVVGHVLLVLNAAYFALAGLALNTVGALAALVRQGHRLVVAAGITAVAALALTTWLHVGPALAVGASAAEPGSFRDAANTEIYGLKVRHLVTPLPDHWFGPFRAWAASDLRAGFPDDTEALHSRLGLVASLGFVGLIATLLFPSLAGRDERSETLKTTAQLAFAATLLATVGGLGAIFGELISPHIRVLARISPFIAFFSLTGVALTLDRLTPRYGAVRIAAWAIVLIIGLCDQSLALRPLKASVAAQHSEYRELRQVVDRMQQALPAGALVFQLPMRPFPQDDGLNGTAPLDLFRPQALSRTLRWSYPATSPALERAASTAAETPLRDLPAALAAHGVAAILFDRVGYEQDGAPALRELLSAPATGVLATTPRYVVVSLKTTGPPS